MKVRRLFLGIFILLVICGLVSGISTGQPGTIPETTDSSTNITTITDSLNDETGNNTVILRLSKRTEQDIRATSHEARINSLQTHAIATQSSFERFAKGNPHVEIEQSFWLTNALVVTVDTEHIPLEQLSAVENVEKIHPNYKITTATSSAASATVARSPQSRLRKRIASPTASQQVTTATKTTAGLQRLNVSAAWAHTRGANASIAVLDTGVDPNHPDININPAHWNDWDKEGTPRDTEPRDYGKHGTHVTGTAVGGNASGTHIGLAPEATLYSGAILNQNCKSSCTGTIAQLIAGMQWAVEQDVDVISLSLGATDDYDDYLDKTVSAVRNAKMSGTIVVAASGNNGPGNTVSPGNVYDSISVGATQLDYTVADFSGSNVVNKDSWDEPPSSWPSSYNVPSVVAPGVNIKSSVPNGEYTRLTGTSQATPHVAGTVALMQSVTTEQLPTSKVKSVLASTAIDVNAEETRQGAGQVDTGEAVTEVVPPANFTVVNVTLDNKDVFAGDLITVIAEIKNTGSKTGTQDIHFRFDTDGDQLAAKNKTATNSSFSVNAGKTRTVTFDNISTEGLSNGSYTYGVFTDDDNQTETLTIGTSGETTNVGDIESVPSEYVTKNEETGVKVVTPDSALDALNQYSAGNLSPEKTLKTLKAYSATN